MWLPGAKTSPVRIALIYGAISLVWIAFSDQAVAILFSEASDKTQTLVQTFKGSLFVLLSSGLVWYLVHRTVNKLHRAGSLLNVQGTVIENTHNSIVTANAQKCVVYVNKAFCDMTGYAATDVIGQPLRSLLSGTGDCADYQTLWGELESAGVWRGELTSRRKSGALHTDWATVSKVQNKNGSTANYIAVLSDITEQKAGKERLHYLAFYDPLTDLPNRSLISENLISALRRLGASRIEQVALFFLDLDDFKTVNESYGHDRGDELLRQAAARLSASIGHTHYLGRFGGDEFVVVVPSISTRAEVEILAQTLLDKLTAAFEIGAAQRINVRASVGICLSYGNVRAGPQQVSMMFSQADSALREAKQRGKNAFAFYSMDMTALAKKRLRLEAALNRAIVDQELVLYYQPVFDLATGSLVGSEALVRWQHPDWGLVSPADFIPLAEETGQIVKVGEWVLEAAVKQIGLWLKAGLEPGATAVNVSSRQLTHGDFDSQISNLLAKSGLPPERLELELTESSLMALGGQTVALLHAVRATGVSLAIDDFGTGYSSLAYLRSFAVDKLKIDRSFVNELVELNHDQELVQAIVAMAKALKLTVQAEGIETPEQLAILQGLGCDTYQGYFRSPPLPPSEFEARFLRSSEARRDGKPQ
ncbi:MAG: EAL domain-containing protein [Marinobacter sp.]|uniref:putative bifunctional diguanylate cyclase/phosphodiesterase n=1 Tax=Marinobacter sp. TaxID=50741 RepID=UPI0034A0AA57